MMALDHGIARIMSHKTDTRVVSLTLTAEENRILEDGAAGVGITASRYVGALLRGVEPNFSDASPSLVERLRLTLRVARDGMTAGEIASNLGVGVDDVRFAMVRARKRWPDIEITGTREADGDGRGKRANLYQIRDGAPARPKSAPKAYVQTFEPTPSLADRVRHDLAVYGRGTPAEIATRLGEDAGAVRRSIAAMTRKFLDIVDKAQRTDGRGGPTERVYALRPGAPLPIPGRRLRKKV